MYALYNKVNNKYFVVENNYMNCVDGGFGYAATYKTRKEAEYINSFIKTNYEVVYINNEEYIEKFNEWYNDEYKLA